MNRVVLGILILYSFWGLDAQDIYKASRNGELTAVKEYLEKDASLIHATNENGNIPLHFAALEGQDAVLEYLLKHGSTVDARNNSGYTPLDFAVFKNHPKTAEILILAGADVNSVNAIGWVPLHFAAYNGSREMVELLLKHKADVNIGSPIHRAIYAGHIEIVRLLLDHGADVHAKSFGRGVLHEAAVLGRPEIAGVLIEEGADVNDLDSENRTPLYWAIRSGTDSATELSLLFIENGADVNTRMPDGETVLMMAVRRGMTETAGRMIEKGARKDVTDKNHYRTLLHLASIAGYADMTRLLIENKLPVHLKDRTGMTALDYAIQHGHRTVAENLAETVNPGYAPIFRENADLILEESKKIGEAYIWYMHNRGWTVKTRSRLLVFDNEERGRKPDVCSLNNGWIALNEIREFPILAIYTGYHNRTNEPEFIHALEDSLKDVHYLHFEQDQYRGGKNSHYLNGGQSLELDGLTIQTMETHDAYGMGSLGYIIEGDGLKIFYSNFYPEDVDAYKKEIDRLAAFVDRVDLAFLYIEPGQDNPWAEYVLKTLKPHAVFPMDPNSREEYFPEMAHKMKLSDPEVQVGVAVDPGDHFHFRKGKIK